MATDEGHEREVAERRKAAAARALAEAAARRPAQLQREAALAAASESGGPAGAEPVRFGDWDVKGIARDF